MTVIELIQKLERIAAEYGNQTLIECRNIAGDLDHLDAIYIDMSYSGSSVIVLDTWDYSQQQTQDYDRGDGVWREFPIQ